MFTLILLLSFSDAPAVTPAELAKVEAREAASMEKFKADKIKMEAKEAYLAATRGEMKRENAELEAKKLADRKGALAVSNPRKAAKYLTVKERAKILYQKQHSKRAP